MSLAAGQKLAHYEIVEPIGRGGLGEVYRARDATLGCDVAIKVLPESMARDSERTARFEREAQLLASLNHPNVATIHGFQQTVDVHFLVMELVEGETLAERIARGPVPVEEALAIAGQIATGLEAAHEKGIVPRSQAGKRQSYARSNGEDSGFRSRQGSRRRGGRAYRPELTDADARRDEHGGSPGNGRVHESRASTRAAVDRRTDIWAFGVVLYEMLTGRQLFSSETVSDTLTEVLKSDVDWSALPRETPESIRKLLRRCLERDRGVRLGWAGDARLEIDDPSIWLGANAERASSGWLERSGWAAIGLAVGVGAMAWLATDRDSERARATRKLTVPVEGRELRDRQAIAPDGDKLTYVAAGKLWIRHVGRLDAREVPDSDGADSPFWSPGSDFVAFSAKGSVWRAAVDGGEPLRLCELSPAVFTGGTWSESGDIVHSGRHGGVGALE